MNVFVPFITNTKSAELMQPRQGMFNDLAIASQSASMLSTPLPNQRETRTRAQFTTMRFRIVSAVALNDLRPLSGPTTLTSNRWNRFNQYQKLSHVVPIRLRDKNRKENPLSVDDEVVFRAFFPAIHGVRSCFRLNTDITEELSTTAPEKSILLAPQSRSRSTSWIFCHTRCFCHRRRYLQQLIPELHPSSCGSISQGIWLRNTYRIPVRARRRFMDLWPGFRNLRVMAVSSNFWISFHKSSGTRSSTFIAFSQIRTIDSISRSQMLIKSLC